jgi:hypothetical protein
MTLRITHRLAQFLEVFIMTARDSLNRSILNGTSDRPSPHTEHRQGKNQLRKGRQLLKPCCQVGRAGGLIVFSVALTATAAFLTGSKTNQCDPQVSPAGIPESAVGMAALLRGKLPGARIVSTRVDGQIDRSFILTVSGWDEDTLRSLPRVSDRAEQWRGAVLCEWLVDWQPAELFLEEWGDYGFALPPFVFFGDKELLAQIKEALRLLGIDALCIPAYR